MSEPISDDPPAAATLRDRLLEADFGAWYRERQARRNAREGKFGRNAPSDPPDPSVHKPHTLLTCHRKVRYREEHAPAETRPPAGLFWVGSRIEEALVRPFLETVAPAGVYVGNSMWVDAEVTVDGAPATVGGADEPLRIRGLTDPVFATREGTPLLPTEVKTKREVSWVDGPDEHHRAQLHAYLYALSKTRDVALEEGVLVYVARSDLAVRTYAVPFDESFWRERVLPWMRAQTRYRLMEGLPPATPEQDWECSTCEFRIRCGKTDAPTADVGFEGFVPGHEYPRGRVEAALAADDDLALTPTLAKAYPDLATDRPVSAYECEACGATTPFESVDHAGNDRPTCDRCAEVGRFARLRGPTPPSQPIADPTDLP